MAIHPLRLHSNTLLSVRYCRDARLLELTFQDCSCYRFLDVPTEYFEALMAAPSKGTYFNQFIRNQFKYQRITGDL